MKIVIGGETDTAHCNALQHELLRCHDAFTEFHAFASHSILVGENRWLAFKMYNAYSRFIHHLYEFMAGALARELCDSGIAKDNKERARKVELFISTHTQRILRNKREAIKNGTAPAWENALSAYPEKIPPKFAEDFRKYRNKVAGHVSYQRSSLSLSDFYDRYHLYLHMLYRDALSWWAPRGTQFPDLKEITDFTVLVRNRGVQP
jgi:hypothetical protein